MCYFFTMFLRRLKKKSAHTEAELWEKINGLMIEIESLRLDGEKKMHLLETVAKGRCQELEERLKTLEAKIWQLNQSHIPTDPDKRVN